MSKNILVASVALLMDEEKQTTKKRRTRPIWRRSQMLNRKIDCAFHTIFKELKNRILVDLKIMLEWTLISPFLQKQDISMRECVSPEIDLTSVNLTFKD